MSVKTVSSPAQLFRTMARIRRFEELAGQYFQTGEVPGVLHLSIGQEGVAAGVCCALRPGDRSTSTHRGHGDMVAAGADVERMFAELFGRSTGACGGKGGSMHIADPAVGSLGANGLVGGGIPIAVGSGLSSSVLADGAVTVAFFGDGAINAGSFHESLNLATIWNLPVLFVCENNVYAQFTSTKDLMAAESIAERAAAYGIPSLPVDGSDVVEVHRVAVDFVAAARAGKGPHFIEGRCFRVHGHTEGDLIFLAGQRYRTDEEVEGYKRRDPLDVIVEKGHLGAESAKTIWTEVDAEVQESLARALRAPHPSATEALALTFSGR